MRYELRDVSKLLFINITKSSFYVLIDHQYDRCCYISTDHKLQDIESMISREYWSLKSLSEPEYANAEELGYFDSLEELHQLIQFMRVL